METIKIKAAELIEVFQYAILDLAAKQEVEKGTLSTADVDDLNYVVGMAQVNSMNLQQVIEQGAAYYATNKEKVNRLITEATAFANSLKKEGFGMATEPV